MSKKKMTIANFNIVFGDDEEPLLNYFESIILPAFRQDIIRKTNQEKYKFMDIEILEVEEGIFALKGILVKSTTLEVKSKFDDNENLVDANELYATAPYSSFIIYLHNHRMVLIKNQKGSPDLRSFSSTVRYILYRFIHDTNKLRKENGEIPLPNAIINIVGILLEDSIFKALNKVNKINELKLKFYPLNGDLDFTDLFEGMTTDLRKKVGSKNGAVILKSPTSISGISEVLTAAQGTVEPTFKVTFQDKNKGTITNDRLSENMDIDIDSDNILDATNQIIEKTRKLDSIIKISEGNQKIYAEKKSNILPFVKKSR